MKTSSYLKLAATIKRNASGYKTMRACELAARRIKAAWVSNGSYGCRKDEMIEAIAECQYRWLGLKYPD